MVMRHAEKLDDVDPDWSASSQRPYDAPITEKGCQHARQVGEEVAREGAVIDVVVCSPFLRCLQTTEHFLEGYLAGRSSSSIPVQIDFGLSEVMTEHNVPMKPVALTLPQILSLAPGLRYRSCRQTGDTASQQHRRGQRQ